MDGSFTQFMIICAVVIVPLVIYLMISDSQSEKDEEEERVSKIPPEELTPEIKKILERRQDFLNNFRNINRGLTDFTGTDVIENIHCDSCGKESDMILYRKMNKIKEGKTVEKFIYYCTQKDCQEFQDIDSSGKSIFFIGGFWK